MTVLQYFVQDLNFCPRNDLMLHKGFCTDGIYAIELMLFHVPVTHSAQNDCIVFQDQLTVFCHTPAHQRWNK